MGRWAIGWYFAWRRALPRLAYLETFSQNYSVYKSNQVPVAQRIQLASLATRRQRRVNVLEGLSSGLYLGLRLAQLQVIFVPVALLAPIALYDEQLWYGLIVRSLKLAGPTFVKLGQWAATRPDVFPPDLCSALGQLHSQAPKHSLAWTKIVFERALGARLEDHFTDIEEEPVGSGAVGQVHRARRRQDGRPVAIKVLHPHVHSRVHMDLQLLNLAASILDGIPTLAWLQLPNELAYFREAMLQQLDLRYEAYTLARFRRNFAHSRLVSFPEPLQAGRSILIESFQQGLPISFFLKEDCDMDWVEVKEAVATKGIQAFMQMLLWDNFVHADLHPGNMLVAFPDYKAPITSPADVIKAHKEGHEPSLVFLDTGLVTELSRVDFENFTDLFKALLFRADGYLAGRLIIERAPGNASELVIDPEGFCKAFHRDCVQPVFRDGGPKALLHLHSFSISPIMLKVFNLVRLHHVHLQGSYTNLVMSLICVEGLGRQLAPQLSLKPLLLSAGFQYLATSLAHSVTETVEPFL